MSQAAAGRLLEYPLLVSESMLAQGLSNLGDSRRVERLMWKLLNGAARTRAVPLAIVWWAPCRYDQLPVSALLDEVASLYSNRATCMTKHLVMGLGMAAQGKQTIACLHRGSERLTTGPLECMEYAALVGLGALQGQPNFASQHAVFIFYSGLCRRAGDNCSPWREHHSWAGRHRARRRLHRPLLCLGPGAQPLQCCAHWTGTPGTRQLCRVPGQASAGYQKGLWALTCPSAMLQATFPHEGHRMLNKALPGTTSSYISPCALQVRCEGARICLLSTCCISRSKCLQAYRRQTIRQTSLELRASAHAYPEAHGQVS